ncbi:TraB/GumN family protein [Candidatus Woesearchaeota archaeon]|nr:TraB/GumN family protein [Candidatus Woesearchaeota archaeon]
MDISNLKIIGTSHISSKSVKHVSDSIKNEKPDIVCVELDKGRLMSLMEDQNSRIPFKAIFDLGLKGYLFALIGGFAQKRLGRIVNTKPGADMRAAVETAKEMKIKTYLIDQDVRITLRKFSKAWKFKDTFNLIKEILFGSFRKKNLPFDLSKVPSDEVIEMMINEVKVKFPSIYKVLIDDRNRVMSRRLVKLMKDNPEAKILVVVGAGHKKGMEELLRNSFD